MIDGYLLFGRKEANLFFNAIAKRYEQGSVIVTTTCQFSQGQLHLLGLEFARHAILAKKLNVAIYFAHSYASWKRGTKKNTNALIRQYSPKGTDFNQVTNDQIKQALDRLNNRPRKTRGNMSPNELFWGQQVDLLAA